MSDKPQSKKSGNAKTIIVALVLCLVCSVMVSLAAVSLKPKQIANIELDRNKNILMAANKFDPLKDQPQDATERFKTVETKLIDLQKGTYATDADLKAAGITDINSYDPIAAMKDPNMSIDLGDDDPARVGAVPKFAKIYQFAGSDGKPEQYVLPIQGNGLWGMIYGFITLDKDLNTIKGISFYQHKETPGLGALIEEPQWRAKWDGIKMYNQAGQVATGVTKAGSPKENWVDGISGATLTSRGVSDMVQFWFSERGYKPFLDNLRKAQGGA